MLALLSVAPVLPEWSHALIDASVLTMISSPIIYFWVIRPYIEQRDLAERTHIEAKRSAEWESHSKSEFLANMSHELRTPLNAIIGFSEMIGGETFGPVGSPKYLEYVKDINESGVHLLQLINDILDLSKIEAGKLELDERDIDVSDAVNACLTLVKERGHRAGVNLVCNMAAGLPPLRADERKVKQILLNLLTNAIKFTPSGGSTTLTVSSSWDCGYVFEVVDTGIGIAPEDIAKALMPFGQINGDLTRKNEGTGLGLPLTKSLVEMHGGSFDIQSEVGVGTTVTARFPAERMVLAMATGT